MHLLIPLLFLGGLLLCNQAGWQLSAILTKRFPAPSVRGWLLMVFPAALVVAWTSGLNFSTALLLPYAALGGVHAGALPRKPGASRRPGQDSRQPARMWFRENRLGL